MDFIVIAIMLGVLCILLPETNKKHVGRITNDPNDPDLHQKDESGQNKAYIALSEDERKAKAHVRPVRDTYVHKKCGSLTRMSIELAETYAIDPKFYGYTLCVACADHFPVDEFVWAGTTEQVGS